jgi:arsenate reductase
MTITIYHNPRCSKSRQTLELIENAGVRPLAATIGVPVAELLRRNEDDFRHATDLPDLDDDASLAAWLAQHPRVMQRPIVIDDSAGLAIIGRPPENVQEILPS